MKIKSENQFNKLHEPSAEGGFSRLPFDPEKYRKYLAEMSMTTILDGDSACGGQVS